MVRVRAAERLCLVARHAPLFIVICTRIALVETAAHIRALKRQAVQ
jgi:hypothetical protein